MKKSAILILFFFLIFISCSKKKEQSNYYEENNLTPKETNFVGNTSKLISIKGSLYNNDIPEFSWINEKNEEINIKNYKGKLIILNFWATWCSPCKKEIPDFVRVYNKYKYQGLEIIGISVDSEMSLNEIAEFVGENDINYQIILDNGLLENAFGKIEAIPTTFIIGKDFKLHNKIVGSITEEELEKIVKSEL